jgi:hypothetical protein
LSGLGPSEACPIETALGALVPGVVIVALHKHRNPGRKCQNGIHPNADIT